MTGTRGNYGVSNGWAFCECWCERVTLKIPEQWLGIRTGSCGTAECNAIAEAMGCETQPHKVKGLYPSQLTGGNLK